MRVRKSVSWMSLIPPIILLLVPLMVYVQYTPIQSVDATVTTAIIRPDGDGTFTDWNGTTGTYTDWDEASPDDDITYVNATAPANESSTLQNPTPLDGVGNVKVFIRARRSGATDERVVIMLAIGGQRYLGEEYDLTVSYTEYNSIWYKNPATDSDWTWTDINNLEAGVVAKQRGAGWTGELRVTQLYVVISSPQAKVYVDPSSVVNTTLTPKSTLTLRPDGDGTEVDWSPCRTLRPNANGTYTEWTGGYEDWDDWPTPNNDTDYVSVSASGKNETSQLEDPAPDETWDIDKVRVVAYARTNETTDDDMTLTVAIGAAGSYASYGGGHTITGGLSVTNPTQAYDGNLANYAYFRPGSVASGAFDIQSYSTSGAPTGLSISSLDFKMKYGIAEASPNKQYRILYLVDPSATEVVLVDWTYLGHAEGTEVWAAQTDPNGDGWSWSDIPNIHFRVDTRSLGSGKAQTFFEYEAWVTVNYVGTPILYDAPGQGLTTSYQKYTSEWSLNPSTNDYWTWSDIDTLEAGVTSKNVTDWTGEIRVTQLYVEVIGVSGSTGTYKTWDETTANGDIDYASTTTKNMYQSSTLEDSTGQSWTIARVKVVVVANGSSDACQLIPMLVVGGWEYLGPICTLTDTYSTYTSEWGVTPETGDYWSWDDIDNLEAGVYSLTVPDGEEIRVTQIYVEVSGPRLTVDIAVDNVPDDQASLWGWQFELSYDPNVIQGVWLTQYFAERRTVLTGPFLGSAGGWVQDASGEGWNNTYGKLPLTLAFLMDTDPAKHPNGSGVLATVIFDVVGKGETEIHLDSLTGLRDSTQYIIYGRDYVEDGYFRNVASAAIPSVSFSYSADSPAPEPLEGYNVTFTASVTSGTPPYTYKWYFWRKYCHEPFPDFDGLIITSTSTATHNYTKRGTWNVTLTVVDNVGVVGTYTGYIRIKAHDIFITSIATNTTRGRYPRGLNPTSIDETVQINVTVTNRGDFTETFNVTCFWWAWYAGTEHYGFIPNATGQFYHTITDLAAGASSVVPFYLDPSGMNLTHPTYYVIHANASRVQYEYDMEWIVGRKAPNELIAGNPIRVQFHDIAVINIVTNATGQTIDPGVKVEVDVTLKNQGDFNEKSIVVKAFAQKASQSPIEIGSRTLRLMSNSSYASEKSSRNDTETITFLWDTSGRAGNYTLWANATQANYTGDYEPYDNTYYDGWVKVREHDVAVTNIEAWPSAAPRGQPVYINVTVENQGDFLETFDVIVYADQWGSPAHFDIGNETVSLDIEEFKLLEFVWDTTGVPCGTYWITAEAILPDDADPADNIARTRVGGIYVPYSPSSVDIIGLLIPVASVILIVALLGAAAAGLFKMLMSVRLRWPRRWL